MNGTGSVGSLFAKIAKILIVIAVIALGYAIYWLIAHVKIV